MPEFGPGTGVIHRTDGKVAALPWTYLSKHLASESYYKISYHRAGSHDLMEVMVFTIADDEGKFHVFTTFELSDVSYPSYRSGQQKKYQPGRCWAEEDSYPFDKLSEALTAAKIEAVLHHAHTRDFRRTDAKR